MTFEGNNQIGSADKPIDLTVPAAAIKVLNQDANNIDDYRAKHSIIFGNLKASYPMSIKNLLLEARLILQLCFNDQRPIQLNYRRYRHS
ncbi:hypothetical protein JCM19052_2290 [Vibrio sp. JCM 19052]|nr:hypothetical protein JCM19052_2290 [Vibrio sp. JCM 19052]